MTLCVLIAGGGIGGLTTAIALRRAGINALVYEKAPELAERGAAILLWPNATRVLRELGVLDPLIVKGDPVTHCEIRSWKGGPIKRWKIPTLSTPAVFTHRADLQSTLLGFLPKDIIQLGRTAEVFHQDPPSVRLCFDSGESVHGDILVGADGLHSRIRQKLLGVKDPVYQGYTQWLAVTQPVHEIMKPGLKMEWWGPGIRFGIGANGLGRMNWYLSVNRPGPENQTVAKEKLLEWVREWTSPVASIIESTPAERIIQTNIWASPPLKTAGKGPVTLLGDAFHPTSPNLGQGAGMAIEDAGCLAACLKNRESPEAALRRYETLRKKRNSLITTGSGWIGRMGQWDHPALMAARTAFLRSIPVSLLEKRLKSMYEFGLS